MSTKICPNCNAEVPAIANLCKHCFHDFHIVPPKKKSPLWTLLFLAVGTALVMSMVFAHIYAQQRLVNITIDKSTESIVVVTTFPEKEADGRNRQETVRVPWKEVASIEYIKNTEPAPYQVWFITTNGDRYEYTEGRDLLDIEAQRLSDTIHKPVIIKDLYEGPELKGQQGNP